MGESLYSKLYNPQEIGNQRLVERFDGNDLDERWNQTVSAGTGFFNMINSIDQGYQLATQAAAGNTIEINFGDIRPFDFASCRMEVFFRPVDTTNLNCLAGFNDQALGVGGDLLNIGFSTSISTTNFRYQSRQGGVPTTTLGSAIDFVFNHWTLELLASSTKASRNGILDVTITTNLPLDNLQPAFLMDGILKDGRIRFMEVLNI